ncbi:hypothetical protein [Bacillus pumilus]|nr:hypothetical protein [Bacillus pumilus]
MFKGEIYKYVEVKEEVVKKGYRLRRDCDREVVVGR